jgi:GNAT superfamily N-acetyltransferase
LAVAEGWRLTTAISAHEKAELGEFLRQHFSGRWEREFRFWLSLKDKNSAFWNSLRAKDDSIAGFARLATRGEALAWCPGALRFPLFPGSRDELTDACLGPIGVADHLRGKGVGKVLLGLSLELLFEKESERLCIDWTNAYNYYKPLGLPAVRSYVSAWKDF